MFTEDLFDFSKYAQDKGKDVYEVRGKGHYPIWVLGIFTLNLVLNKAKECGVGIEKYFVRWPGHTSEDMGITSDDE